MQKYVKYLKYLHSVSEVNISNFFKKNISLHKNPHSKRNNGKRNTKYVSNKKIVRHFFPVLLMVKDDHWNDRGI